MAFLFSYASRTKSPHELVRQLSDALIKLESSSDKKVVEEISKSIEQIKVILYGDDNNDPSQEQILSLTREIHASNVFIPLINNLGKLDFDSKKDVTSIFITLLHKRTGNRLFTVDYLASKQVIITLLLRGPENPDAALNCSIMLRDCLKYDILHSIIINSPEFWKYFKYSQSKSFETATDSFSVLRDMLSYHRPAVLDFLLRHQTEFFSKFNSLMNSKNYVTKRQSVKLLAEILLSRQNYAIMTAYVESPDHLKLIMNLLRDKSKNIQYEAFQIFKVFVANPKKSKPVLEILQKNREKLLSFLESFTSDRKDDTQFNDERRFLIKQIHDLPPRQNLSTTSLVSTASSIASSSSSQTKLTQDSPIAEKNLPNDIYHKQLPSGNQSPSKSHVLPVSKHPSPTPQPLSHAHSVQHQHSHPSQGQHLNHAAIPHIIK